VFTGGSNGILQSCWAALRFPERVHGVAGEGFHPSVHRVLGEQAFGWMIQRLTGSPDKGADLHEVDFLNWGRYAWNQGLWLHDISFLRRFWTDHSYRPALFTVGDDDISSSGTDFVAVAANGAWSQAGIRRETGPNWPVERSFAWSVGDTACHGDAQFLNNPYPGGASSHFLSELTHDLIEEAIDRRNDELLLAPPTIPPFQSEARTSSFRALDEPHEWALGRAGEPISTTISAAASSSRRR